MFQMYQIEPSAKFEWESFGQSGYWATVEKVRIFADNEGGLDTYVNYSVCTPFDEEPRSELVKDIPTFAASLARVNAIQTVTPEL